MKEKLAIIGGGIAGLYAGYRLQNHFDVTLFDAGFELGGNNYGGLLTEYQRTPMGVIIFPNETVFTKTHALARNLNLPIIPYQQTHVFQVNHQEIFTTDIKKIFRFSNLLNFPRALKDYFYLNHQFHQEAAQLDSKKTIRDLVNDGCLSHACAYYFLLPFASLYLSMPYHQLITLPIYFIAYWWKKYCTPLKSLRQFTTIEGGAFKLIQALHQQSKITTRVNTPVHRIIRSHAAVTVRLKNDALQFDKIILATRPDEALRLLDHPTDFEKEVLSAYDVGEIKSTLHRRNDSIATESMVINLFQKNTNQSNVVSTWEQSQFSRFPMKEKLFVSIHEPDFTICKPQDIIDQKIFRVPLFTQNTFMAMMKFPLLNKNATTTFYCGAYTNPCFYHEDAICSVDQLTQQLDVIKSGDS